VTRLFTLRLSMFAVVVTALAFVGGLPFANPSAIAQSDQDVRDEAMIADAGDIQAVMAAEPEKSPVSENVQTGIDLLTLILSGGVFMIPIGLMSLLVVALAVERFLALRKRKLMPRAFVENLRKMLEPVEHFNPGVAFRLCEDNPSPVARVVESMLLRTGRPLSEIESAASDTINREAERCAAPIRWLSFAAAATPLMGLLGTVWGMIVAFHQSTTLTAERSRSEQLSEGIYTALVTTLAGLIVAIPASILTLYLENRLIKMFHRIEELAFRVAPGLSRFTGNHRLDSEGRLHAIDALPPPPQPPLPPPLPSQTKTSVDAIDNVYSDASLIAREPLVRTSKPASAKEARKRG
jgi:biopolymer transport protein ExbB